MKMNTISSLSALAACAALTFTFTFNAAACGGYGTISLDVLARQAVSTNQEVSAAAISRLRARGQAGLDALLRVHEQQIVQATQPHPFRVASHTNDDWARIKAALEAVAQQRDCEVSKLFWFTDLEQAKAESAATGKPILSLRLLGMLNEEYSCANSRFFRTTLYANTAVSAYLHDHFVLHWKSVRPVPRITVDFGDGRKIERTVTGNSIHYVLDSSGRVVDALPGLYGAQAFLTGLKKAETMARSSAPFENSRRDPVLREYHQLNDQLIQAAWRRDLQLVQNGLPPATLPSLSVPVSLAKNAAVAPSAERAGAVTASKSGIERPLLKSARPGAALEPEELKADINDGVWMRIAALHAQDATLDDGSRALIRSKSPSAIQASRAAMGKTKVEDPLIRSLRNLERSISEDTIKNEYLLHSKIHQWLAQETSPDLDRFNARVYSELFLTPDSDPWLGLVPPDVYSALDNDGLVLSQNRK
jgi:hypothetical protein